MDSYVNRYLLRARMSPGENVSVIVGGPYVSVIIGPAPCVLLRAKGSEGAPACLNP